MRVQIFVNNKELEMYENEKIKYTFQVNDIMEMKDRQVSFTHSFNIPRTEQNIRIFEGLGIPSDVSTIPYKKVVCQMKIEGFDFIVDGYLQIRETTKEAYKINLFNSIAKFFKSISNETFASYDLSELNHIKNLDTIVASHQPNSPYRYLIADYGGDTIIVNETNQSCVNGNYLLPSVSVAYLWNKIFEKHGFWYEGSIFNTSTFKDLYLN